MHSSTTPQVTRESSTTQNERSGVNITTPKKKGRYGAPMSGEKRKGGRERGGNSTSPAQPKMRLDGKG